MPQAGHLMTDPLAPLPSLVPQAHIHPICLAGFPAISE
jgi:hypothetical protein